MTKQWITIFFVIFIRCYAALSRRPSVHIRTMIGERNNTVALDGFVLYASATWPNSWTKPRTNKNSSNGEFLFFFSSLHEPKYPTFSLQSAVYSAGSVRWSGRFRKFECFSSFNMCCVVRYSMAYGYAILFLRLLVDVKDRARCTLRATQCDTRLEDRISFNSFGVRWEFFGLSQMVKEREREIDTPSRYDMFRFIIDAQWVKLWETNGN